ncbi:MAG: hypothetical protein J6I60_04105 [Bacteroidaceae bacterium]|nr:hypothetical protein [Bacteroidaceae bacterium]
MNKTLYALRHMQTMIVVLLAGVFTLTLTACGDDDKDDLTPPVIKIDNAFYAFGEKSTIKTAAFFHDNNKGGYNFLFSDEEENLNNVDEDNYTLVVGRYFVIDFPDKLVNQFTDLATADLNSDDWSFYVKCDNIPIDDYSARRFVSGTLSVNISGGFVTITMNATDNGNDVWRLTYDGQPEVVYHFLSPKKIAKPE